MNIITKSNKSSFKLIGFFKEDKNNQKNLILVKNKITEYINENVAYIYLGSKKEYTKCSLKETITEIVSKNLRSYEIDAKSFVSSSNFDLNYVANQFVDINEYINSDDLYNAKTAKKDKKESLTLFVEESKIQKSTVQTLKIAKLVNYARKLQETPPNICNSEWLAKEIEKLFKGCKNIKVSVLNKKEIEKQNMNLFLSVNKGSAYEPRLVVIEYNGDPKSKTKTAYVGKGITYDSGGYNLKPSAHILGMKYDMSGAAICAAALRGISEFAPKKNVVAVLPLTDNKISSTAQVPDSIWTAMNGKTVEVNNTDAEGRLILADAITYAISKTKATRIVDIATLTGAIIISLGTTFTGVWATSDKAWKELESAATKQGELVWRMPFHNDFLKNIKSSHYADYKNTDLSGKGGSNSAAMFLKEFTNEKEYIHLDIAGTASVNDKPTGAMVKTLIQLALD